MLLLHNRFYASMRCTGSGRLKPLGSSSGRAGCEVGVTLVSLVSVRGRNLCYLCETVKGVEKRDIIEIANIHAVFMHVAENMLG